MDPSAISLTNVPPSIGLRLSVAVGAKNAQVLDAVVRVSAVDVIQFQRNRTPLPLIPIALLAPCALQALGDEPPLEFARFFSRARHEDRLERTLVSTGKLHPSVPSLPSEVGCIKVQVGNGGSHGPIVPSDRNKSQHTHDLCHRGRESHRDNELIVGPRPPLTHPPNLLTRYDK